MTGGLNHDEQGKRSVQNAVIDVSGMANRKAGRGRLKGRQVDPRALAEIKALLGDAPRRRDLLIEFLHRIQDGYGSISAAHIVALAQEMALYSHYNERRILPADAGDAQENERTLHVLSRAA